ncbi:hypothetical protein [Burkholderia ubonensis]|uniref:hypothetical protein n=1 Tax=Burkholderia ubonensis TaxID=101571 RepID=UPI00075A6521|nr:hypothetical protein [Burkholderia ubonensis]KVO95551.1 hypothetical protein WJ81_02760 [Burkholderia ubonensis]KVZ58474.1 hypothetical protein WL20_22410 [Burkholderia ubonensis]
MKLCINCQYYDRNALPPVPKGKNVPIAIPQPGMALCLHPSTMDRTSLITGEPVRYTDRAAVARQRYVPHIFAIIFDRCGSKGRHFTEFRPLESEESKHENQ